MRNVARLLEGTPSHSTIAPLLRDVLAEDNTASSTPQEGRPGGQQPGSIDEVYNHLLLHFGGPELEHLGIQLLRVSSHLPPRPKTSHLIRHQ